MAAVVTVAVGFAGGTLALGHGPWPSLGAGIVFGVFVFAALRLAARRNGRAAGRAGRIAWILAIAGGLMVVAGLLALRIPDVEKARLLAAVAFGSAGLYFAAGLFQRFLARRKSSGT
jgi:hypothetical protein